MKIISRLFDYRVQATDIMVEISMGDYLKFAPKILQRNEFQRRRIHVAGKIYSLLKDDLLKGCIIPPIVLAYIDSSAGCKKLSDEELAERIQKNIDNLLILDGLQRTYTILDLYEGVSPEDAKKLDDLPLRIEIYLGITRPGVLYRMLTLNSGQTPMSLRHQIEVLYSDYIDSAPEGIKLIKQTDTSGRRNTWEYRFRDIIDGFQSYIETDELPIDRKSVLKSLQQLSKENYYSSQKDIFHEFLTAYHHFVVRMDKLCGSCEYSEGNIRLTGTPFGKDVGSIFSKSIPITGFGSAIGKLMNQELIDFSQLHDVTDDIQLQDSPESVLANLLIRLDEIKNKAKKIGNAQRFFFHHFFRGLFNKNADSFKSIDSAIEHGYKQYKSQMEL